MFFFINDHLHWAGRVHVGVDPSRSSVHPVPHLGGFFTWTCSMTRESTSKPLSSALLSALLSTCSKNSELFLSHRPCIHPPLVGLCTLPNSTIVMMSNTHCFCKVISFKYLVASHICIVLKAWAVSQVFLKWTQRFEPLSLHDILGVSGSTE